MIDFDTFTKLPKNVGNLGKIIVATGFEWLLKVQKITQPGHTVRMRSNNEKLLPYLKLKLAAVMRDSSYSWGLSSPFHIRDGSRRRPTLNLSIRLHWTEKAPSNRQQQKSYLISLYFLPFGLPLRSIASSVTRWLDYLSNIWPFTTIKFCPII